MFQVGDLIEETFQNYQQTHCYFLILGECGDDIYHVYNVESNREFPRFAFENRLHVKYRKVDGFMQ